MRWASIRRALPAASLPWPHPTPSSVGSPAPQQIREDASSGVFVAGASERAIASLEEFLLYLEEGEKNRAFAFTHLNAHSSRSHAVVMITVVKSRK